MKVKNKYCCVYMRFGNEPVSSKSNMQQQLLTKKLSQLKCNKVDNRYYSKKQYDPIISLPISKRLFNSIIARVE